MKKEMLKQLIKEEIRQVLNEKTKEKEVTSGTGLATKLKKDSQDLMRGSTGISPQEAKNVDRIIQKLLKISKDKNVSTMVFSKIEKILDRV
jgi:hypothetical protein